MILADVLEALTGQRVEAAPLVINEGAIDSRQAAQGSLFVALKGENTDGHNYVADAFQNGAALALIERELEGEPASQFPVLDLRKPLAEQESALAQAGQQGRLCLRVENSLAALQTLAAHHRRKMNARVIGITGSVGKSTTKEVTAQVLSQRYRTLKNIGNLNNEIGLPLTLLRLTPEHERAVLEMGFYVPGEITQLCEIALPVVGVITNVGMVHAERAGSMEVIAQGKGELVESLPPGGTAILNYDDPYVRPMRQRARASVFYYGLDPQADLWADEVEGMGLEGIRFRLHFGQETLVLRAPLIGRHSVHTALRAAAVGLVEGLRWSEIIAGLQQPGTQLRLVASRTQQGALLLDDSYNASPESTLAALNLLYELEGRRIAVLGDMLELGQYERQGHEMVGARAAVVADRLIAVGERARAIADSALAAGMQPQAVTWLPDAAQVIDLLAQEVSEGDVLLVKGSRGMRMDRIVTALEGEA